MNITTAFNRIKATSVLATRETQKLVVLLLVLDAVFIVLHIGLKLDFISNPLLSIEKDRGYSEAYQYTKEIWACMLLLFLSARKPRLLYVSWAVLFFYILLDDSMQVHENLGRAVGEYLNFQPMLLLRAVDFGELLVSAISGSIIFGLIAFASIKSEATERKRSMHMFLQVLILVFFGVLVDMIHIASPWGKGIWGLIEDGGEMIIMSILLGYIFNLKRDTGKEMNAATA